MSDRPKDLIAGIIIAAGFVIIRTVYPSAGVANEFILLLAILFFSQVLGKRLIPTASLITAILLGLAGFLGIQSILQTVWFYAAPLGIISDAWTMLGTMAICSIIPWITPEPKECAPHPRIPWNLKRITVAAVITAATLGSSGYVLWSAIRLSTSSAIRTPWPILPAGTLLAIALCWLGVLLMAWLASAPAIAAILSGIAIFTTTAIAPLLYRIGFGFDGFLHIATERLILASGTLTPKPLYYIGQYVFTTWLSRIANLPINQVDRWLVPAAAAIFIPLALVVVRKRHEPASLAFGLFILPLAAFVATTPQSFSYLLGLTALLLVRGTDDGTVNPIAPLIFAGWSAAVHPIAGIPMALLTIALILLRPFHTRILRTISRTLAVLLGIGAAFAIPVLFYISSLRGTTPIEWNLSHLWTVHPWIGLFKHLIPLPQNAFVVWPGWSSLIILSLPAILITANIVAIIHAKKEDRWRPALVLGTALLLFVAGAALKTAGNFAFLIDYERGNYADRLAIVALFCLIPTALPVIATLIKRARNARPTLAAGLIVACLVTASALSYDALPRNDALVAGHGWSVSSSDIAAVRAIERNSGGRPYTVLADQSVSAAAVSQYGFKRYNGNIFYYPIPTGGKLYNIFLKITYNQPSRDTIKDAAKLGGTKLVYVVLNDYWWNAPQLADKLSLIAQATIPIGKATQGIGHSENIYIFDLSKPSIRATQDSGS